MHHTGSLEAVSVGGALKVGKTRPDLEARMKYHRLPQGLGDHSRLTDISLVAPRDTAKIIWLLRQEIIEWQHLKKAMNMLFCRRYLPRRGGIMDVPDCSRLVQDQEDDHQADDARGDLEEQCG